VELAGFVQRQKQPFEARSGSQPDRPLALAWSAFPDACIARDWAHARPGDKSEPTLSWHFSCCSSRNAALDMSQELLREVLIYEPRSGPARATSVPCAADQHVMRCQVDDKRREHTELVPPA